jgi:methylmalonyl-CoA mutase cobalamin-binding subunit
MHDTPDTVPTAPEEPLATSERAAIDDLLRRQLGRRMTVCLLALADTHADDSAALAGRLASIEEIAILPAAASVEEGLAQAAQRDAEIVLIWLAADDARELAAVSALLERIETMGLSDRSFVALIGPAVTRDLAHRLRFEEGYPAATPSAQLLRSLAREAIGRDELRRRGSSPPCYL